MPTPSGIQSIVQQDDGRLLATFADGSASYLNVVAVLQDAVPLSPVLHRSAITAADGTTKPAANNALWTSAPNAVNPGGRTQCRVFVSTTGAPTAVVLRAYLRSGGSTGQVGSTPQQNLNAAPNSDACFDVSAQGDDVLVYVESITGGTAPSVSIATSWR